MTMKALSVLATAIAFFLVVGCDGDGEGVGVTTETTTEETETTEETQSPVTIDTGSHTVGTQCKSTLSDFNIFETGTLEATVKWYTGPPKLDVALTHDAGSSESTTDAQSPASLMMEVTQDRLDDANGWILEVYNPDTCMEVTVDFVVRFTPD
jgi:hypothetical protein